MEYDLDYWNKYTDENESKHNEEFSKFIKDLATSLRSNNVLDVGCNSANDLSAFPNDFDVHGVDLTDHALDLAKKKFPTFKFKSGSILDLPYEDSSFDFVFTHYVLNYISEEDIDKAISELYRVSKKYILNCELYNENEGSIDGNSKAWKRNAYKKWLNYQVKIVSDVDMHEDIEPKKPRFTLVKKIN